MFNLIRTDKTQREFDGRWAVGPQYDYDPPPTCDKLSAKHDRRCHLPIWHNGKCAAMVEVGFDDAVPFAPIEKPSWTAERGYPFMWRNGKRADE